MRKLIIVDLYNHSETKISNADILFLNQGKLTYKNCEIIDKNINKKKIFKRKFLTKINNFFDKQKNYLQKKLKNINSIELDIFNLRNDKTKYLEKLCTIMFSKKIAQKYKHVELVIDNEDYLNIYNQVYNRKFEKILLLKKNNLKKININNFFFKFILKSLYFIFLSKILSKNKFISNKKIYLSFYPYLFNKNKDISIYGKKNIEYLNFSLTDESHLNLHLLSI